MKETIQQRRLRQAQAHLANIERKRDQALKTLVKCETQLPTLRKRLDRLRIAEYRRQQEGATAGPAAAPTPEPIDSVKREDGLDIPSYLKRSLAAQAEDAIAERDGRRLAALPDPRAPEKKAQRKEVEKQVRQAELTGKRRRMPLSGKAALDAIRDSR
jgi:multidrug resistance efflux pump